MEVEKIAAGNGGRYRLRFRGQMMTVDAQALRDLTDWGLLHMRELEAESMPSVFHHLQRQQEEGQADYDPAILDERNPWDAIPKPRNPWDAIDK